VMNKGEWAILIAAILVVAAFLTGMFIWGSSADRKFKAYQERCSTRCPVTVEADHCRAEHWSEWTIERVCGDKPEEDTP
jgi:hypothetical protein